MQRVSRALTPEAIPTWLNAPVPLLDGDTPLERIAGGDYETVASMVSGLESPGFS